MIMQSATNDNVLFARKNTHLEPSFLKQPLNLHKRNCTHNW